MAAAGSSSSALPNVLSDIVRVCWGTNVKEDIFLRWTQGFQFSVDEPTALVQYEGGPCAVLAPAQAFILKHIVDKFDPASENWRAIGVEDQNKLLVHAVVEMLKQAVDSDVFHVVYIDKTDPDSSEISFDEFHSQLKVHSCSNFNKVAELYNERSHLLHNRFGVLLFLYSMLYSKVFKNCGRREHKYLCWAPEEEVIT